MDIKQEVNPAEEFSTDITHRYHISDVKICNQTGFTKVEAGLTSEMIEVTSDETGFTNDKSEFHKDSVGVFQVKTEPSSDIVDLTLLNTTHLLQPQTTQMFIQQNTGEQLNTMESTSHQKPYRCSSNPPQFTEEDGVTSRSNTQIFSMSHREVIHPHNGCENLGNFHKTVEELPVNNCTGQIKHEHMFCDDDQTENNVCLPKYMDIDSNGPCSDDVSQKKEDQANSYPCDLCKNSSNLFFEPCQHKMSHTKDDSFYICDLCQASYKYFLDLKSHLVSHTGETEFTNDLSDSEYPYDHDLRNFETENESSFRVTTELRPHKIFPRGRPKQLNMHRRIHAGKKLYSCSMCAYECAQLGDLKQHMKSHPCQKQYTCGLCDYTCDRLSLLERHNKSHTGFRTRLKDSEEIRTSTLKSEKCRLYRDSLKARSKKKCHYQQKKEETAHIREKNFEWQKEYREQQKANHCTEELEFEDITSSTPVKKQKTCYQQGQEDADLDAKGKMNKKRKQYTQSDMEAAMEACRTGLMSKREAATYFNIPRSTLGDKLVGLYPVEPKSRTVLSPEEEAKVVEWVMTSAARGCGQSRKEVCLAIQQILNAEGRETSFTDNLPGSKWYYSFLQRHPDLKDRKTMAWFQDFQNNLMSVQTNQCQRQDDGDHISQRKLNDSQTDQWHLDPIHLRQFQENRDLQSTQADNESRQTGQPRKMERKKQNWSQKTLQQAVEAVNNGMGKRQAADTYGIPWGTFSSKLSGRRKLDGTVSQTVLTPEEEQEIVTFLESSAKRGFKMTREDLLVTVQNMLNCRGRETKWKNNLPQEKWFKLFNKRFPGLAFRTPQKSGKRNAMVTKDSILKWFQEFSDYIKSIDPTILLEADRIYNCGELGFGLDASTGKVISFTGNKQKLMITTIACCSASGNFLWPMIIYPGNQFWPFQPNQVFPQAYITKSNNGLTNQDIFSEWLETVFIPQTANIKRPRLLLVDEHTSHMSMRAASICKENNVILYALPPNSSHVMRPMYVGIFKTMKSEWHKVVSMQNKDEVITTQTFAKAFKSAYENTVSKNLAAQAFKSSGLFPLDLSNIQWDRVPSTSVHAALNAPTEQIISSNLQNFSTSPTTDLSTSSSNYMVTPTAISIIPAVTSFIPDATSVIPGATSVIPGATSVIPGATSVIPGATCIIPGATSVIPGATSVIPGATSVISEATSVIPGATSVIPGATSVIPEATSVIPGATSFIPDATSVIPGATSVIPGATSVIPGATSVIPGATSVIPGATSVIPGATSVIPGATSVIPGATSVIPGATSVIPGATCIIPGATSVIPVATSVIPDATSDIPDSASVMPVANSLKPDATSGIPVVAPSGISAGATSVIPDAMSGLPAVATSVIPTATSVSVMQVPNTGNYSHTSKDPASTLRQFSMMCAQLGEDTLIKYYETLQEGCDCDDPVFKLWKQYHDNILTGQPR